MSYLFSSLSEKNKQQQIKKQQKKTKKTKNKKKTTDLPIHAGVHDDKQGVMLVVSPREIHGTWHNLDSWIPEWAEHQYRTLDAGEN